MVNWAIATTITRFPTNVWNTFTTESSCFQSLIFKIVIVDFYSVGTIPIEYCVPIIFLYSIGLLWHLLYFTSAVIPYTCTFEWTIKIYAVIADVLSDYKLPITNLLLFSTLKIGYSLLNVREVPGQNDSKTNKWAAVW